MEITILGAHNVESANTRLVSILIDGVLALDAGSLTSGLSLGEQERVKSILLTHAHYDHIRDIAALALNNMFFQGTIEVYGPSHTLEVLFSHFLDGSIYPKFTEMPSPERPTVRLHPLEPYEEETIGGYSVLPLPVDHNVAAVGYQVSTEGQSMFYSGDTGLGLSSCWGPVAPQLLIAEATLPNRLEKYAVAGGHLSPGLLKEELVEFRSKKGYLPPVVTIHMSPQFEGEIGSEVEQISRELGASITLACEGMRLEV